MAWLRWALKPGWFRSAGPPPAPPSLPATPEAYAAALLAAGFDAEAYRAHHETLTPLGTEALAEHYHLHGRDADLYARFAASPADAGALAARFGFGHDDERRLRQDLAAALLHQADLWGRDEAMVDRMLAPGPGLKPLLVIGDSHGELYLTEGPLRFADVLPVPSLCTGASARGLGNPNSRGGAGERIRGLLAARGDALAGMPVLLKFGQVDLEFVHDFQRMRDGRTAYDPGRARAFAAESAERYLAFVRELAALTPARLVVSAALPPALSDEALRRGYVNAHIAEMNGELDVPKVEAQLRALEMPDWDERTALAGDYNRRLREGCATAGLAFLDDFTPLLGPDGRVHPDLLVWHGGTDHHLCFNTPTGRALSGALAQQISSAAA